MQHVSDTWRVLGAKLLWGRGLRELPPNRRLAWDAVGLVVTLGVLAAVAVVLSFDRSFAVAYLVAWAVFHVAFSVYRYVKAVRRRTSDDTGKAPLPSNP
jgi:hypothetical protein